MIINDITAVSSIMIARGAQSNVSIFCNEGLLPKREIAIMYIKKVSTVSFSRD